MTDTLGRILTIILAAVMLFIMPTMFVGLKEEKSIQIYVDDAVTEFVDRSNAIGYISEENYLKFTQRLSNTGLLYDVEIVHYNAIALPDTEHASPAEYITQYEATYTEDILSSVFPDNGSDGLYQMKNGDFLSVSLTNKTSTIGMQIYNFLVGRISNTIKTIKTTYGGYVGGVYLCD